MINQSEAWASLSSGCSEVVSDEDLAEAHDEVTKVIHCLCRIKGSTANNGNFLHELVWWSEKISKIQSDRQAANRPELSSNVRLRFSDGHVAFYGLPGGDWSVDASEQTEQLRGLLEAVYETTRMVNR